MPRKKVKEGPRNPEMSLNRFVVKGQKERLGRALEQLSRDHGAYFAVSGLISDCEMRLSSRELRPGYRPGELSSWEHEDISRQIAALLKEFPELGPVLDPPVDTSRWET